MLFRLEPCGHDWPAIALGAGIEVPSTCKLCGGSVYEALLIDDETDYGWGLGAQPLARITVNLTEATSSDYLSVTTERDCRWPAKRFEDFSPEDWDD